MGSNNEKNEQIGSAPKIISPFWGTTYLFMDCMFIAVCWDCLIIETVCHLLSQVT